MRAIVIINLQYLFLEAGRRGGGGSGDNEEDGSYRWSKDRVREAEDSYLAFPLPISYV